MKPIDSAAEFNGRIKQVIVTEEQIKEAIQKAGKQIDRIYDGRPILWSASSRAPLFLWQTFAALSRSPVRSVLCVLRVIMRAPFPPVWSISPWT